MAEDPEGTVRTAVQEFVLDVALDVFFVPAGGIHVGIVGGVATLGRSKSKADRVCSSPVREYRSYSVPRMVAVSFPNSV